jgi:hypothetical protein
MGCGGAALPILPLIDLLILMSTANLIVGFVLKALAVTTHYRPAILGFTSIDFVIIAGIFLGLALVLAARTWVKLNEPRLLGVRSRTGLLRRSRPTAVDEPLEEPTEPSVPPEAARSDPR